MRLDEITREQKLLAAAAACGLWIIALFLPWVGANGIDVDGSELIPSFWIFMLLALAAGVLLGAEGLRYELPAAVRPVSHGGLLTFFPLVITAAFFLEAGPYGGRSWGLFVAMILAIAATALALWVWRDEPGTAVR